MARDERESRRPLRWHTLRWDVGGNLSALGEAFYTRDPNRTVFRDGPTGISELVLARASSVGFAAALQARF